MKRIILICLALFAILLLGCERRRAQTGVPSAEATPAQSIPSEGSNAEEPAEDVIVIPKTEWIVTTDEGMPTAETLREMQSLRLLDLTALPYTPYPEIEEIMRLLPDCRIIWNQKLTDGVFRSDTEELTLPHATEEDVELLHAFGNLRTVDAAGSTAYEALAAFRESHPNVVVHYTLAVGDQTIDELSEELTVPSDTDADDLTKLLHAFPNLKTVDLRESGWSDASVDAFIEAFPDMTVQRYISVGTQKFDSETGLLDLRTISGLSADSIRELLPLFRRLQTVALPSDLDADDTKALAAAFPDVLIAGPVTAFGQTFDGGTEEIDLSKTKLKGTEEVEALIQKLPFLKKAVLCDCELTNEQMESLCAAHPDIKFVWTLVIGKRKLRTDAIGFSTKNPSKYTNVNSSDEYNESVKKAIRLKEGDIEQLKYCTDLEALDLGHNYLTNSDLEVIAGLTKLKILILADNKITDISALTTLKDLEYIELFMNKIPDLSPLTEMPSLVDVNVCNTGVSDLTPLFELTGVKRLWYAMNPFSREQAKAVKEALPDCECNYTTRNETAEGWRDGPRYRWMRSYFE
ncbi:MAG: leucine-rich repeat domain-containing protein [Clostridia bacterium]|nr:leucine-rich repeat domain-containing protein [Clostridia bacterium]